MEGQIKCFSDKGKLKEFIIITKPLVYEMLMGLKKKKIKMATNSKITTESKTKQTSRTGTES